MYQILIVGVPCTLFSQYFFLKCIVYLFFHNSLLLYLSQLSLYYKIHFVMSATLKPHLSLMLISYSPSVFSLQSHPALSPSLIFWVHLRLLFLFSSPSAFSIQLTSSQLSSIIIILAFSILLYSVFSICSISCFHSCHLSPFITPSPQLYWLNFPLYHPWQSLFINFFNCLFILNSFKCNHVFNTHGRCSVYSIFMMFS